MLFIFVNLEQFSQTVNLDKNLARFWDLGIFEMEKHSYGDFVWDLGIFEMEKHSYGDFAKMIYLNEGKQI